MFTHLFHPAAFIKRLLSPARLKALGVMDNKQTTKEKLNKMPRQLDDSK